MDDLDFLTTLNLNFAGEFLTTSNLNFAGYTSSKNQVRNKTKIKFVQLDFSNSIFRKSSADQEEERVVGLKRMDSFDLIN